MLGNKLSCELSCPCDRSCFLWGPSKSLVTKVVTTGKEIKKKKKKTQRLLVVKLSEVQKLEITKVKSQNYVIVKVKQPIYWHMRTRFLVKTFSILIYLNLESKIKLKNWKLPA